MLVRLERKQLRGNGLVRLRGAARGVAQLSKRVRIAWREGAGTQCAPGGGELAQVDEMAGPPRVGGCQGLGGGR